ncbi:flavonol 4'-sulfotransferase-like [Vitis vinifera]|uniref:flavonol 4'-sulfotransferase-like n=1 Tax=Vitis vinifera TaxID=29760 RepID=UPI00053FC3A9|nr:flavonol 4'-sulfotransferase-like [Vitis vinifera]|eukprot:XP_010663879.1 PREDICTED: flavonol 4'-sulfotransferase-like [Vitis vinifera]
MIPVYARSQSDCSPSCVGSCTVANLQLQVVSSVVALGSNGGGVQGNFWCLVPMAVKNKNKNNKVMIEKEASKDTERSYQPFQKKRDGLRSICINTKAVGTGDNNSAIRLSFEEAFEQYCKGFSPYGPFWDHILGYWKANSKWPERVLLLKYEDMKRDSSFHLKRIAEFIGQPFSSEEEKQGLVHEIIKLCSFESLSNMKVNKTGTFRAGYLTVDKNSFFRKGEVGDWKNHLTAEMAERLDKITERNLDGCDFSFDDSKDT